MNFHRIIIKMSICILAVFSFHIDPLFADENDNTRINSFEKDLTGDGFEEYIQLHGNRLGENSFYQKVWLTVQDSFKKSWTISLQQGYEPEVLFLDITGDKNPDMFYKVAKDEGLEHFYYQLYQFKDKEPQQIKLPDLHVKTTFEDNFTINIAVSPTDKPMILDISSRKNLYIDHSIYNADGKWMGDISPVVGKNPIIEPVLISHSKGYGLKTTYPVYGVNRNDLTGELEVVWYYKNNKWVNMHTKLLAKKE